MACGNMDWSHLVDIFAHGNESSPVTVSERSEEYTVFTRSQTGIVGSNPTQGIDIWCVCAFLCVCVVLCLGRGLSTSWSPVQGVLPSVNYQETEKSALCSKMGARGRKNESSDFIGVDRLDWLSDSRRLIDVLFCEASLWLLSWIIILRLAHHMQHHAVLSWELQWSQEGFVSLYVYILLQGLWICANFCFDFWCKKKSVRVKCTNIEICFPFAFVPSSSRKISFIINKFYRSLVLENIQFILLLIVILYRQCDTHYS
jgi:hypothetical protein